MRILTVIIPTLNEEEGISVVLDEIPYDTLRRMGYTVEVLVVDGGSTDRTADIALSKGARVILEDRKGYGRACKTGFEHATGDTIVTIDGDTSYPARDLARLVSLFEQHGLDFLTTDRLSISNGQGMSPIIRLGNLILSLAFHVLFRINISDVESGMWIFRSRLLDKFVLTCDAAGFSEEVKIEAFESGARCMEVPIVYRNRVGKSKKLPIFLHGFKELEFLLRRRLRWAKPGQKG